MKIIFGGAFNPITNAHIKVYEFVKEHIEFQEFIFLPVSSLYTKSDLASDYHRLNMLKLGLKDKEKVRISELELNDSDFLGTYQSLIRFSDGEQTKIGFVIGADNLLNMHMWINIEGILSEFTIIVLGRNGIDIKAIINDNPTLKKFSSSFLIFEEFKEDISSTEFRKTFDASQVPQCVYDYIIENGLYKDE
jgi:nicotinate-nucleotide adenylyltransferase